MDIIDEVNTPNRTINDDTSEKKFFGMNFAGAKSDFSNIDSSGKSSGTELSI